MTVWSSAAQSSIRLAVITSAVRPYGVGLYNVGLWPGSPGQMSVTMGAGARTAIVFGAEASMEHFVACNASTAIAFSVSGGLTFTWADFAPCETSTWALTSLPTGPANDPSWVT